MDKLKKHDSLCLLSIDGKEALGIDTGFTSKALIRTDFSDIRKDNSYILKNGDLTSFNFDKRDELNEKVVIYSSTISTDFTPLINGTLESIAELLYFLEILKSKNIELNSYNNNQFYKDREGNPFILSPKIINFINDSRSLSSNEEFVSKYKHPNMKKPNSMLFSLGILLYETITKEYPYNYNSIEDLRDKMRRGQFRKAQWINHKLKPEVIEVVTSLLTGDNEYSYNELFKKVEGFIKEGITDDLNNNLESQKKQYSSELRWFNLKEKSRAFFIKNKGAIIGFSIGLILAGSFFGTIIYNALQPPITTGYTQEQVVESYFTCFQTLDTYLMDDVLKKGVKKRISDELASVYVTTKIRGQYEGGTKPTYTPAEWYELPDDQKNSIFVYGIHNLEIEKTDDLIFIVKYEKWISENNPTPSDPGYQDVFKWEYSEIFTLEKTKYSYVISNIETLKEEKTKIW